MAEQMKGLDCATVIGPDVVIKGDIQVEKGLRLDGRIEGTLATRGKVLVGKSGSMDAEVRAGQLLVEGKVQGNLVVSDRIELAATGRFEGDLTASKLVVAEGAIISGKLNVGADAVEEAAEYAEPIAVTGHERLKGVA